MFRSVFLVGVSAFALGCASKSMNVAGIREPAATSDINSEGSSTKLRLKLSRPAHYIIDATNPKAMPEEIPFYEKVKHDNRYCRVRVSADYNDPSAPHSMRDGISELNNNDVTLFVHDNQGYALKDVYNTEGYERIANFYKRNNLLTKKTNFERASVSTIMVKPYDSRFVKFPKRADKYYGFRLSFIGQPRQITSDYNDSIQGIEKLEVFCLNIDKDYYPNVLKAMSSLIENVPSSLFETSEIWEEHLPKTFIDYEYTKPEVSYNNGKG